MSHPVATLAETMTTTIGGNLKRSITVWALAASLALAGCSSATPETAPETTTAPPTTDAAPESTEVPMETDAVPGYTPIAAETPKVDVTAENSFTFEDGFVVTFDGAKLASADQVGSDPVEGSEPVILEFTYENGSPADVDLQAVPLSVWYGADLYDADSPTLYQDSGAMTDLPKQITVGSTVKVINTYWIPKGEPITVGVDVAGVADQMRANPTFIGITLP